MLSCHDSILSRNEVSVKSGAVQSIAGVLILVSLWLGWFISPYWIFLTAFVGFSLFQSSITKWCLFEDILKKVGVGEERGEVRRS